MTLNTCLSIEEQSINFVIDDQNLNFVLADSNDLGFVLADVNDMAFTISDSNNLAFGIDSAEDLSWVVNSDNDLRFVLTDVVMITAILQDPESSIFAKRVDFVGDNLIYRAEAAAGSLDSEAAWRISRVEFIGADVETKWALGNDLFDKIWDDRLNLAYL